MPYFIILPFFILAVVTLSAASILVASVPRLRPMFPFFWRVLLWSSTGVLLANIPVFCLYFVPLLLETTNTSPSEGPTQSVLKYSLVGGLLLGPFIASAAGFLGGALFGVRSATRAIASRPNNRITPAAGAPSSG
jgi:uncharacterized membrane-anchored protein YitT (DUF2179 family)